ncbi:Vacuolar iron transporter [Scedosporium apiospermum]|uniref:Vacuolar iron transporter n=1 Tax=Pseudallescheria apiosperma TaxID=563466 RepID=A0A084G6M9_PSEDA|nr:Vacuolar iron transporter [Scedosporium apiospermum]KEZ42991.1 Vacuolar iron transporter [Scedosporium apiospermum]
MSVALLKTAIFGAPAGTPTPPTDGERPDNNRRSSAADTIIESDIESLNPKGGGGGKTKSKIDPRIISDATIGLSDGLTVPFALTAGLSALGDTKVVIYGGFAELIAGALSMGLGGYLGAKSEAASYRETRADTEAMVRNDPVSVHSDIRDVFKPFELDRSDLESLVDHLAASPKVVDFLMQFHHCSLEPPTNRAFTSAFTIAMGYFLGGFIPLLPYFFVDQVFHGLYISVGVMALALFVFGYVKTCVVCGWRGAHRVLQGIYGGLQMVVIGGVAAGSAMGLVMAFNHISDSSDGAIFGGRAAQFVPVGDNQL